MIKITLRKFILFSVLGLGATAHAAMLNLVTEPAHKTIGGKRFVAVKKDDLVTFTVSPEKTIDTLTWTFDGGTEEGPSSPNGPHMVRYGENAEGLINEVKFTSKRTVSGETCETKDKVTCQVLVPKITFDYSRGVEVVSGKINWSDPPGHPWGAGKFDPPSGKKSFLANLWIQINGIGKTPFIPNCSGPCNTVVPVFPAGEGLDNVSGIIIVKVEIPDGKRLKIKHRVVGKISSPSPAGGAASITLKQKEDSAPLGAVRGRQ